MSRALDGLDASQLAAASNPSGPLLIVGGAGTGKTRTLTRRFLWLVEQGLRPDAILALTFSSAAAADMRARLETLIDVPYEELSVLTLQGFCAQLLRAEALEIGVDPALEPVTQADRVALLVDHVDELPLRRHQIRGNPAPLAASFVRRIDRLKDELVDAGDFRRYAEQLAAGRQQPAGADGAESSRVDIERELEFAAVYERHDQLLAEAGALDFGGLVLHASRLLDYHRHVRARLIARYRHVLVDEYQDMSSAQASLLRLLATDRRELTVVGDDDQAIHRPRGAAIKNLVDFEREHPDARIVRLERSHRSGRRILNAAAAVVDPIEQRLGKRLRGRAGGQVRFWRCRSERAQAQAVAREAERLVAAGVAAEEICVLVRSVQAEGSIVAAALEERAIPHRLAGAAAYFQRAEIRDALAWLRLLADPADAGAVVRALSRPPIELRAVDIARLTQLARRRKLDMVAGLAAACEGPQLSPEGRERAASFLRLHRAAQRAFEEMRPDAFVHRLVERIGLRRQGLYAHHAETVERLLNIAKLSDLATAYMRREPDSTARDFGRYLAAVAEAGVREQEAAPVDARRGVQVMTMHAAKGLEFDHVFVLGLGAGRMPGTPSRGGEGVPEELAAEPVGAEDTVAHDAEMRRLLHVAMTRARKGLVLSWDQTGAGARPSRFYEEARAAVEAEEEVQEEELFGPAEGLHSTFRMMRNELLDSVGMVAGRLGEMRLDTYLDVSHGLARYLELVKVAALIERTKAGQDVVEALPEVNDLLLQSASPEQREAFELSSLDDYLLDSSPAQARPAPTAAEPSLQSFLPRRGDGLMLSATDIETYRLCPLKYKFARVYRIPQEPSINQRFGIVMHQVLERFHAAGDGSLETLVELFEAAWRRSGFGDSTDEQQFRERALAALRRYREDERERASEPIAFERGFAFKLGPHLLRGRVDRVDRLPDGRHELIDYKTGKPKTALELREDVQLSLYQMGARESWGLETSAQSYYYVLDGEKVPVEHSEQELERVRATVGEIADGITRQAFEPTPSYEICSFCDYRIICPAAEK